MITAENYLYYVLLFFTGSILGWCIEVCCKLIQYHRFINRGFLVGPWCPIYGFGTVFISVLLTRYSEDPFAVFGLAILICGVLEYTTSYMMEKIFHARWWDYSTKKFNLNGRICSLPSCRQPSCIWHTGGQQSAPVSACPDPQTSDPLRSGNLHRPLGHPFC